MNIWFITFLHHVRFFWSSIVLFQILKHWQIDRIYSHVVHPKEGRSNEISSNCDKNQRRKEEVKGWKISGNFWEPSMKYKIGHYCGSRYDYKFSNQKKGINHFVQNKCSNRITYYQFESLSTCLKFSKSNSLIIQKLNNVLF